MTFLEDIEGDGVADYAVGAMNDYPGAVNAGRVLVYSGRTGKEIYRLP